MHVQKYFGVGDFPGIRSAALVSLLSGGSLASENKTPEFPKADMLLFLTTTIHSPLIKHVFFRITYRSVKAVKSFHKFDRVTVFEDGRLLTARICISESCCHFETEGACGHIKVISCPGTGTLCRVMGPAGPLDVLLIGLGFLGHRKNPIQSLAASKSKGKRRTVLDC